MMKRQVIDCIQGSDEWYEAKLGIVSTSHFSAVLNKGSGRNTYMMKLLAERMTGLTQAGYTDKNLENGSELEPLAREYYEAIKKVPVAQVGFVKIGEVGASPDGLVGDDGCIEIKCPLASTHLSNILRGKMPTTYIPQVQGVMWVCERKWCDFISYCPTVKSRPFWLVRVLRDDIYIDEQLIKGIDKFLEEIHNKEDKLNIPF